MGNTKKKKSPLVPILVGLPLILLIVRIVIRLNTYANENGTLPEPGSQQYAFTDEELRRGNGTMYIIDDFVFLPFDDENNMNYFEVLMKDCDSVHEEFRADSQSARDPISTYYWGANQLRVSENDEGGKDLSRVLIEGDNTIRLKNGLGIGSSITDIVAFFGADDYDASVTYSTVAVTPADQHKHPYSLHFYLEQDSVVSITYK